MWYILVEVIDIRHHKSASLLPSSEHEVFACRTMQVCEAHVTYKLKITHTKNILDKMKEN